MAYIQMVVGPVDVFVAPADTAEPEIDTAPSVAWKKFGVSKKLQKEGGVKVESSQSVEMERGESTAPLQAFRTEEDVKISLEYMDVRHEILQYVLNGNAISDNAPASGLAGNKSIEIARGPDVTEFAILIRGKSPYVRGKYMQLYVPRVVHTGNTEIGFTKSGVSAVPVELMALEGPNATDTNPDMGRWRSYTAAALP
jgi:hypothetical protein